MDGWIKTAFSCIFNRGPKTATPRFVAWMMVSILLTMNSILPRAAYAQTGASDAGMPSTVAAQRPVDDDVLCSPLPLSSACGVIDVAGKTATPAAHASSRFAFALPDLGNDRAAKSRATSKQPSPFLQPVLQQLAQAGQFVGSGVSLSDLASNYAASRASQYVVGDLQRWLSQYGTASISMGADIHGLRDGSANFLLPLFDNKGSSLVFTQLGYQRWEGRNTINVGLGARHFNQHSMYGANVFFDNDVTGHNQRLGAGFEYGTDYFRLAANGYLGLTGWHQSRDYADYDERPANGFDVSSQMYLPSLPQLGAKLKYEQYFGNGVDLFGTGNRQKNPFAITAGLDYTPVPALTLGASYRRGEGGLSDVLFNAQLTYRMGVPLSQQFDPRAVASMRSLAGSRYDLVQRNNRIVLDYRKRVVIRLTLGAALTGFPGEVAPIPATVTSTYGVQTIQWSAPALMANGGVITAQDGAYSLTFPTYQPGGTNTYTITAVARDRLGNTSSPAQMQVTVESPGDNVSIDRSTTDISPNRIYADGQSTALLTITVLNGNGDGVAGLAQDIVVKSAFANLSSAQAVARPTAKSAASPDPVIGPISAQGDGVYVATITAGTALGTLTVTPSLKNENVTLKRATLQLVATNSAVNATLTDPIVVTPQATQPADGQTAYTFSAHVIDANTGNALANYPLVGLRWQVNPSPASLQDAGWLTLTSGSSTTDANGNITATLASKVANVPFTVSAQLGSATPHNAPPVSFSIVAHIASLSIVNPASGNTEIATLNNVLNTPVILHAPLPLSASAQDGYAFIARIVDARGLPVANQLLSSLNFQWLRGRSLDVNDRYFEQTSTDGLGQAIAYFGSVAQTGSTGAFTLAAQLGGQAVRPAQPANVAFTDIPGDTHQVQYVGAGGVSLGAGVIRDSQATTFVKNVTFARLDPNIFNTQGGDTFVTASSSAPDVISVDSSTGLMNALKPGTATVGEVFAHNGYRFTRYVTLTPQSVLYVPYVGGTPLPITSPSYDPDGDDNTCEKWSRDGGDAGIESVTRTDADALKALVPVQNLLNFWGASPPPVSSRRFYMADPSGQNGWSSMTVPGGTINRNDQLDGTLVCKVQ